MAITTGPVTLDGLKFTLDGRDRVAAQVVAENNNTFIANTAVQVVNPVSGSASAITVTKATHAGRTTMIPQSAGSGIVHVMPTPVEGVKYHFVYVGGDVANEDISFDLTENGTFEGAITFLDNGGSGLATVYCTKTNNDVIDLKVPNAFDLTFIGKDTSTYYVYGNVTSATTLTCTNG
tara:strand:- start:43 stop:576 length:534 start_codon:yes stop_codon:yes gene_type:complete